MTDIHLIPSSADDGALPDLLCGGFFDRLADRLTLLLFRIKIDGHAARGLYVHAAVPDRNRPARGRCGGLTLSAGRDLNDISR